MDSFTAQANPGNVTVETKKPSSSFGIVFLFLIVLALGVGAFTVYTLMGQNTPPQTTTIAEGENPFATQDAGDNPFSESALAESEGEAVNPFVEEDDSNPFAQFDTTTSTSPAQTNTYENPF